MVDMTQFVALVDTAEVLAITVPTTLDQSEGQFPSVIVGAPGQATPRSAPTSHSTPRSTVCHHRELPR